MVRGTLLVLAASFAAVASASSDGNAVGVYRLRVSPEARSMARMVGRPEPDGCLKLAPDHTFTLTNNTADALVIRGGHYYVDGSTVTLAFRSRNRSVSGLMRSGRVVLEGLVYERDDAKQLPDELPPPPIQKAVWSPDPNPKLYVPAAPAEPVRPIATTLPADFSIVGDWTVHKNGHEDRSIRMCFDNDGNFTFKGMGAKSSGKYEVHGTCVTLTWLMVDDEAVEPGTMKKDLPICPDGCSFNVDTYRYERATKD